MSDSALFSTGALFSTDYLREAIRDSAAYRAVDVTHLRARLDQIAAAFPQNARTNESQTEDDFIWPVLAALGWSESLRQQNLTVTGRDDVPDGLLFADVEAKAGANALDDQWRRYAHGLAVVESVKAASDVYAPVSGEVVEANDALSTAPETVNSAAEADGWFARSKVSDASELDALMDQAAYDDFLKTL